jgi:Flp pilus assembly protein TadB
VKQRKPTKRILIFALAAMVAFIVLALLNLARNGVAAIGFMAVAFLWWLVFVSWRRKIDVS